MTRLEEKVITFGPIAQRLRQLQTLEEKLNLQLTPKVGQPPLLEYKVKLPKKLREISLLFYIRGLLPVTIRVAVEETYSNVLAKLQQGLDLEQLLVLHRLEDTIVFGKNPRWLDGRAPALVLDALNKVKLNLCFPKSPTRTQRRRGYSDHGSKLEISVSARRDADVVGSVEEERQLAYARHQESQLTQAAILIDEEHRGGDPAELWGSTERLAPTPDSRYDEELDALLSPCGFQEDCPAAKDCLRFQVGGDPSLCPIYKSIVDFLDSTSRGTPAG